MEFFEKLPQKIFDKFLWFLIFLVFLNSCSAISEKKIGEIVDAKKIAAEEIYSGKFKFLPDENENENADFKKQKKTKKIFFIDEFRDAETDLSAPLLVKYRNCCFQKLLKKKYFNFHFFGIKNSFAREIKKSETEFANRIVANFPAVVENLNKKEFENSELYFVLNREFSELNFPEKTFQKIISLRPKKFVIYEFGSGSSKIEKTACEKLVEKLAARGIFAEYFFVTDENFFEINFQINSEISKFEK